MFFTPSITANFLLLGILGLILGHTFFLYQGGRWLMFDPLNLFWGGALVVYVEQPISYAAFLIGFHGEELFCRTLAWVLFGLVFVVIGYETRAGGVCARKLPKLPSKLSSERVTALAYVLILLGLASYAYDMRASGGAEIWLSSGRGGSDIENTSAYLREFQNLLPVGVIVLLFEAKMPPVRAVKQLVAWVAGALMWCWYLYLGTRSRTIMFTVALLAAEYLPRRKNPPLLLLAPVFVGLWLLTSFQGYYRSQFTNLSLNLDLVDWEVAKEIILPSWLRENKGEEEEASRYLEFNCVMTVVKLVPSDVDYNYGYGHLEVFTRPIPRSLWPGKRYPHLEAIQGVLLKGDLSDATGGLSGLLAGPSLTFAGDWYYAWGPMGLALGGLLTGFLFRMFREYYEISGGSLAACLIYLQLLYVGFNDSTGTPFYWLITLSFPLLSLFIAIRFCRERSHRPVAADRMWDSASCKR